MLRESDGTMVGGREKMRRKNDTVEVGHIEAQQYSRLFESRAILSAIISVA